MQVTPVLDEPQLVAALRASDEAAFMHIVRSWHSSMLRVAQMYVPNRSVAEEVIQETWIGVLKGIDRFEGRSSLKTWIYRILANNAKTRAVREGRHIPFSALDQPGRVPESAVDADRFRPPDDAQWPGGWIAPRPAGGPMNDLKPRRRGRWWRRRSSACRRTSAR